MGINTNQLKKFAQNTRRKLIQQVGAKVDHILSTDSAELRDVSDSVKRLRKDIDRTSREDVIEQVAYTWFNRLTALRYMDLHDYQPLGLRIISPRDTGGEIELYQAALQNQLPDELKVDHQQISQLLTGQIASRNPHTEVMRILLVATCQNLHLVMPFLFDRINSYAELLLPDDLLSDQSVLADFRRGMTVENSAEVEVIGWLYQFYISEKKDAVFASKGKVKKEEIPAATQLFTPRWIVEYMVQNTVGKLWLLNNPGSRLRDYMPYYIESSVSTEDVLTINNPEELTLLDQACGSGHILVYGFDLLYKIYEEAGYPPSEIPELIIRHNLRGFEIDPRAAQLATLALTLKAREYHRRFFRKTGIPVPQITCFEDFSLNEEEVHEVAKAFKLTLSENLLQDLEHMRQATQFGSLIRVSAPMHELRKWNDLCNQNLQTTDIYLQNQITQLDLALTTLIALAQTHSCIVDNPPYMGSGNMNKELSTFVKTQYPESKADLMACFMESGLHSLKEKGYLGMINQHSWMFLSSYEKLRKKLIQHSFIDTLLHLGPRTFPEIGGEVVQNTAFTLLNHRLDKKGRYIRLVDFGDSELKRTKTLEAIQNPDCGWFYTANQKDFEKIPGSPVGYWLSENMIKLTSENKLLSEVGDAKQGLATADNNRFLRLWAETRYDKIGRGFSSIEESVISRKTWFPYNKGGKLRRWYGNQEYVVNWENDGSQIRNFKNENGKLKSAVRNEKFYFRSSISWGLITSGGCSFRYYPIGFIYDVGGMSYFPSQKKFHILGFLNTKVYSEVAKILNPTINLQIGDIANMPYADFDSEEFIELVEDSILISKSDWNSHQTSWDFKQNELLVNGGLKARLGTTFRRDVARPSPGLRRDGAPDQVWSDVVDGKEGRQSSLTLDRIYDIYKKYWTEKFYQLHANEEELNRQFIQIYGLKEELTPEVPLDEITILQEELDRKKLKVMDKQWTRAGRTIETRPDLPFKDEEVMGQLVSYAVGCMFGRYSLDKEGLILANQSETVEDYLSKISLSEFELSFLPDNDAIIPVMDEKWFDDDIVSRMEEFLKVAFGIEYFRENMNFLTDKLGSDLRRYFVREFYKDHISRYKKRPIYWMLSSPEGHFRVLIYMHRYTADTLSIVLNKYLNPLIEKLETQKLHQRHLADTSNDRERRQAEKEIQRLDRMILDCKAYRQDTLYPLALKRIEIDLDDGVLVNYNKFGKAVTEVTGLNDKKAKAKVRKFDWIDVSEII